VARYVDDKGVDVHTSDLTNMTKHFQYAGWVVAVALLGILVGGGFQAPSPKFGTADLGKVAEGSDYYKTSQATFDDLVNRRKGVLEFFNQYGVVTSDEAKRIQELSLKTDINTQEKAELDRLKQQVIADDSRKKELSTKSPSQLTPEERTLMAEFARREETTKDLIARLSNDFTTEMDTQRNTIQTAAFEKARDAVRQVAKDGGYTLVFSSAAAPFGANDITDDAIKQVNKK